MLTQERLKEALEYDPITGLFIWRIYRHCVKGGNLAGTVCERGKRRVQIDGKRFYLHWLVSLYLFGCMPEKKVYHVNGDNSDNRAINLTDLTETYAAKLEKKG